MKKYSTWKADRDRQWAGEVVRYVRGSSEVQLPDGSGPGLVAMLGTKPLRIEDADGSIRLEWTDLDLYVRYADLVIDSVQTLPKRGDIVIYDEQKYEVFPVAGEPHYRFVDPFEHQIMIRTKRVEVPTNL